MNKLQIGQIIKQKTHKPIAGLAISEGITGIVTKVGHKNVWVDTLYGGWAGKTPMILNVKLAISDIVGY